MGTAATSANQSQQFKVQAMEIRKERHSNVYHIATVPLPKKIRFLWGQPEPVHPDASVTQRQSSFASMESETLMPTLFCEDLSETQTRKMHKNDPMNSSNRQIWNNHQKTCTYNCQRPTSNSTCLFSALVSFENADSESAEDTQKCSQGRMASTGTSHQMGTPLVV